MASENGPHRRSFSSDEPEREADQFVPPIIKMIQVYALQYDDIRLQEGQMSQWRDPVLFDGEIVKTEKLDSTGSNPCRRISAEIAISIIERAGFQAGGIVRADQQSGGIRRNMGMLEIRSGNSIKGGQMCQIGRSDKCIQRELFGGFSRWHEMTGDIDVSAGMNIAAKQRDIRGISLRDRHGLAELMTFTSRPDRNALIQRECYINDRVHMESFRYRANSRCNGKDRGKPEMNRHANRMDSKTVAASSTKPVLFGKTPGRYPKTA